MKQVISILICFSIFIIATAQSDTTTVKNTPLMSDEGCPHLIFKFGIGMSRMPAIVLKSMKEARVEMSDFSKSDYTLQKFTITILRNETHTFERFTNEGKAFTEKTKTLLSSLMPNDIIMVSGIAVADQSGKIFYIEERNFGVY